MEKTNISELVEISLLTALITILGMLKLPNLFPGAEFQLSAPLAVAVCATFGFKKYLLCSCLSSAIGLLLGTQNLLNVAIAMQFRLIVGLILWLGKNKLWSIIIAGPIASFLARLTVGLYLGKLAIGMIIMAVPGMIFTMILSPVFVNLFHRVLSITMRRRYVV